jgi:hypothetical protein
LGYPKHRADQGHVVIVMVGNEMTMVDQSHGLL